MLKPETVKLVRINVLGPNGISCRDWIWHVLRRARRSCAERAPPGAGSYWWGGACGTWFWIDPANDVIFIGMVQNSFDLQNINTDDHTPMGERMRERVADEIALTGGDRDAPGPRPARTAFLGGGLKSRLAEDHVGRLLRNHHRRRIGVARHQAGHH